jgi:hypothetical protein
VAVDLLEALYEYLIAEPTIRAVFTDQSGGLNITTDEAPPTESYPYLVIAGYDEEDPGLSLDDDVISLTLVVVHTSLDALRAVSRVVRDAVDSIAINPDSVRIVRLSWTGGIETGVTRRKSRPKKVRGKGPVAGTFAWREEIEYEFNTTPT